MPGSTATCTSSKSSAIKLAGKNLDVSLSMNNKCPYYADFVYGTSFEIEFQLFTDVQCSFQFVASIGSLILNKTTHTVWNFFPFVGKKFPSAWINRIQMNKAWLMHHCNYHRRRRAEQSANIKLQVELIRCRASDFCQLQSTGQKRRAKRVLDQASKSTHTYKHTHSLALSFSQTRH